MPWEAGSSLETPFTGDPLHGGARHSGCDGANDEPGPCFLRLLLLARTTLRCVCKEPDCESGSPGIVRVVIAHHSADCCLPMPLVPLVAHAHAHAHAHKQQITAQRHSGTAAQRHSGTRVSQSSWTLRMRTENATSPK